EVMVFFHPQVAEQRYVGTLITTKQVLRAQQGVLSALLPAPDNLDRGELKDTLHQGRESTDAGTQNHQSQGFAPDIARRHRSFLQRLQQRIQAAADETSQRSAQGAVAQFAERSRGDAFTE